jgi:arylformamidase
LTDFTDITLPLRPQMPIWPGSVGVRLTQTLRLAAGDPANVSRLDCDVHVGTHVDAPCQFLADGCSVDQLPLEMMIGPVLVAHLPGIEAVTADALAHLALFPGIRRLLLRTRNSEWWAAGMTEFREDYVALTAEAAQWVVNQGIRLIGVDYLSVQRYRTSSLTHRILLGADVIVLEGLNLANVEAGVYELICLPLRLVGADGAPARAVLRHLPGVSTF